MKKALCIAVLSFIAVSVSADEVSPPFQKQFDVPQISKGVGLLDAQKEKRIGEKVYRQVEKNLPVLKNVWLEDQFMMTFSRILSTTSLGQPIALVVVSDPQINAFAVPGGLFALNTGLVLAAKNLDEVVGVMAHEVAHVTQRHYSRSTEAFKGQALLALAGIIAGAVVASKADGEAGTALMVGTQAALLDRQLSYSRDQEREADRIGMQLMYAAGFNPESMADFFETMHRSTIRLSFMPDFWLTHPLTTQRMSEARLRANQLPKIPFSNTQTEFDIMKWYIAVLTNQTSENQLKLLTASQPYAGKIALSAFYLKKGEDELAQQELTQVIKRFPYHHLAALLQADLYLSQNKPDLALEQILTQQKIAPENRALSYKLAEIYIRKNDFKSAQLLVEKFVKNNPRDISGWMLMQQAADLDIKNTMRTVNVLRYRAEVEYWSGEEEGAIRSLLHAQRLSKSNNLLSAKVDQRLSVMQDERRQPI